jgi:AcrR family transcriptional regulator
MITLSRPSADLAHFHSRLSTSPRRSNARERILREAMRLFAQKGYERTSIADIQAAAGLTPGSGALYKHFPSKEALLEAGIAEFIETNVRARDLLLTEPDDVREALAFLGSESLRMLQEERDDIRVAWRELEAYPDLQTRVRRGVMEPNYRAVAAWLAKRVKAGDLRPHDTEGVSLVLLGSLVLFRVFDAMWGQPPLRIADDRFARAWSDVLLHGLLPRDPRPRRAAKKRKR